MIVNDENMNINNKKAEIKNIEIKEKDQKFNRDEISLNPKKAVQNSNYIYKGMEFTKKIKYKSLICDRCFRLIYISFNDIQDCVSTYCLYCKKLNVYTYDKFLKKIEENKNQLLNLICKSCNKSFIFSDDKNPFYLIEKNNTIDDNDDNNEYFIICSKCLKNNKYNEYKKKVNCEELMGYYLYLYDNGEKENQTNKIKDLDKSFDKYNKEINEHLIYYEEFKNKISFFESIIKDAPLTLRKKAEKKILKLKKEIEIKNKIIEYYNQLKNFITINNMLSLLHTILDLSEINNSKNEINNLYKIIQDFLNCEKCYKFAKLKESKKFFNYSMITKSYINKDESIKEKNEPKELKLDLSFLDVININLETGETYVYKILADYCFSEKLVPIPYNYNKNKNNIDFHDILIK